MCIPQCCSLSMDLAIDVVVGMPLKDLDVPWIKQCARTFMDGLYAPPFNLPGEDPKTLNPEDRL